MPLSGSYRSDIRLQARAYQYPLSQTHHPVTVVQQDKASILEQEIRSLLDKGAIAKVPESQAAEGFYSTLFLVPKKDGQYRPVINLRNLNYHLKTEHLKMEGMHIVRDLLQTQDWMTRLSLKDAYFAIPVHHEHRKFLRFRWGTQSFQFNSLPFGLPITPRLFTKVLELLGFLVNFKKSLIQPCQEITFLGFYWT